MEIKRDLTHFFKDFLKIVNETCNLELRVLIKSNLDCFGPRLYGENILINLCMEVQNNLFNSFGF